MEIAEKVVLITGASSGIGLATARLFAQKGAKLALAARSTGGYTLGWRLLIQVDGTIPTI